MRESLRAARTVRGVQQGAFARPHERAPVVPRNLERELAAIAFTKISVKKCANPGPSAFWDGEDDRLASGKLGRATAEISAH